MAAFVEAKKRTRRRATLARPFPLSAAKLRQVPQLLSKVFLSGVGGGGAGLHTGKAREAFGPQGLAHNSFFSAITICVALHQYTFSREPE